MKTQEALCSVYLLIAHLFRLSGRVKPTGQRSVLQRGQGNPNSAAELHYAGLQRSAVVVLDQSGALNFCGADCCFFSVVFDTIPLLLQSA